MTLCIVVVSKPSSLLSPKIMILGFSLWDNSHYVRAGTNNFVYSEFLMAWSISNCLRKWEDTFFIVWYQTFSHFFLGLGGDDDIPPSPPVLTYVWLLVIASTKTYLKVSVWHAIWYASNLKRLIHSADFFFRQIQKNNSDLDSR